MKRTYILFLSALTFYFISPDRSIAQDTLRTNYPDSEQVWEKVFRDKQKVNETVYFEDGSTWMTASYKGKEANWKWYHENGKPYFEATIIADLLQGSYKIWYENGQLAEQIEFTDNLENGLATFYYPNGQIAMRGSYLEGKMVGSWKFFNDKGEPYSGDWVWKLAADQKTVRVTGKLVEGEMVGAWQYRTTAGTRQGPLYLFKESH